jgi:threonine dehydratase
LRSALAVGHPISLSHVDSFVDGASVARVGDLTFAALSDVPIGHVLIAPEDRICVTILDMLNVEGIVLEPAGALSVDALVDMADDIRGQRVVCVTSGGNFDFERLPEVKERAQRYAGLKKYFLLRLPQRPGALRDFLEVLGPDDDIARFEYLKKSARNFGTVLIGIETKAPENFERLFARLDEKGFSYTDVTENESVAEFIL